MVGKRQTVGGGCLLDTRQGKNAIRGSSHQTSSFTPMTMSARVMSAPRIGIAAKKGWTFVRYCEDVFETRERFCFSTIVATSASSCFASYTIPSLIVYFTPPTCSGLAVLSFSFSAPVP